jgi:hypothetical protein
VKPEGAWVQSLPAGWVGATGGSSMSAMLVNAPVLLRRLAAMFLVCSSVRVTDMHRDVSRVRLNLEEPLTEGQTMPPAYS